VYWNRSLFAKHGVPAPADGWTWDEFAAAAKSLTLDADQDGRPEIHGLAFEPTLIRVAPFVIQAGGTLVDDASRPSQITFSDVAAYSALDFLLQLRNRRVVPSLEELRSEDVESRFAHGRAAMALHSRRFTPTLRAIPELDWDVAPLPMKARAATMLHADGYCMAKKSRLKAEAWRFVEFALGPAGAEVLARTGRTVPSLKQVAMGPAFLDAASRPPSAQVFLDSLQHAWRTPNIAAWNEIETRADPIVEEWFFNPPSLDYRSTPATYLGRELSRATRALFEEAQR
jgi:multiple sugar transport system substrate-binding protein